MSDAIDSPQPRDKPATRDDRFAFPRLTDDQIKRASAFGEEVELPKHAVIFERGQRSVDFFVVLEGSVQIYDDGVCDDDGEPITIHTHGEHGFTGELDLFSDRKILVSGRLACDGRVLRVKRENFQPLLAAEPDIGDVVMRAFILRRLGLVDHAQGGALLIGKSDGGDLLKLQRFLDRNAYPMKVICVDEPEAVEVMRQYDFGEADLPVVVCSDEQILRRPTIADVADAVGLTEAPDVAEPYDVTVIGAGPAGLAAAVYAASEGLRTLILEAEAPGGQAGTSSRIENYLGFPAGLSGQELAGRAMVQAQKFGATLTLPRRVRRIELAPDRPGYCLHLDTGEPVPTRSVVIACGARWRTLDLPNFERFEGAGIHYAATAVEAGLCGNDEIVVVGGGNSAGQAAVYLSRFAKHVHMLVRSDGLAASMSDYLVRRIELSRNITLRTRTEVTALAGDANLRRVTWTHRPTGETQTHDVRNLFLMIGAIPNTDWLHGTLCLDDQGFIVTGSALTREHQPSGCPWQLDRPPHPLESSKPGVFAVGDLRAGSVKRVASAVGEGSVCVQDIHRVLAEHGGR